MIPYQTIGSARAENRKDRVSRRVIRNLLTALLASALTLPSLAVWGMESSPKVSAARPSDALLLPPIPYLESTPWMKWDAAAPALKIDTLMAPSITPWGILQSPKQPTQEKLSIS